MRSGNSYLRKQFENITGLITGSDNRPVSISIVALQFQGLKGEGIADNRCWI